MNHVRIGMIIIGAVLIALLSALLGGTGTAQAQEPEFLFTFGSSGSGDGEFLSPREVDVDLNDAMYVLDRDNRRVQVFDASGSYLYQFPIPGSSFKPAALAVDTNSGNIVVVDAGAHRAQVFDTGGTLLFQFGSFGSGDGQFNEPINVDIDENGKIYVADFYNHRIQIFAPDGSYLFQIGSFGTGDGEFNNIHGVYVDPLGQIYGVDFQNKRVQVFDDQGTFLFKFDLLAGTISPSNIHMDQTGRIYVIDETADHIQVYAPGGTFLFTVGTSGSGNGQFHVPRGITFMQSGNLVVADAANNRIQVFAINGAPDCSTAVPSTDLLWPPNHKFVSIDVLGVTDPDGDGVTLSVDSIYQDEAVDAPGSGKTAPDGQGVGTASAQVRAERVGGGNGRVYHIGFTAEDGNGGSCSGEVLVSVPHKKKSTAVDDGALFDSTVVP